MLNFLCDDMAGAKDPCRPQDGPGPVVPIANLSTNHGCVPFNYMGFNCSCCTTTPGIGCFSTWAACLTSKCLPTFPPVQLPWTQYWSFHLCLDKLFIESVSFICNFIFSNIINGIIIQLLLLFKVCCYKCLLFEPLLTIYKNNISWKESPLNLTPFSSSIHIGFDLYQKEGVGGVPNSTKYLDIITTISDAFLHWWFSFAAKVHKNSGVQRPKPQSTWHTRDSKSWKFERCDRYKLLFQDSILHLHLHQQAEEHI